jgi:DNA-binding transcriptional MerR regulator/mannose-6-phosphate isomerase-like protein (cupin superfamily)
VYLTDKGGILLSIQEAAREIGVVPATIRNWEKQGIFTSKRAGNGYRVFDYEDMTRLRALVQYSKENKLSVNAANTLLGRLNGENVFPDSASEAVSGTEDVPGTEIVEADIAPEALKSDKWKKYRQERGFVLEEVAKATNISPSYLHKIENEQTNVSLDILQRLADFYGENLLYYIADAPSDGRIVRKGLGKNIPIGIEGVSVCSLSAMSHFSLSSMLYTVEAHSGRVQIQSHHGEEFVYILSGKIHFTLNNVKYVLSTGDCMSFRSQEQHSWFNHEKRPAQILWIYTPLADRG